MKIIKSVSLVLVILLIAAANAYAVKKEFKIAGVDYEIRSVSSQDSNVSGLDRSKLKSMGQPQGWGVVSAKYESLPDWADEVEVKYYLLMKNNKENNKTVMLAGSIVYMHVSKSKKHFSSIYVPPQAVMRYGEVVRIRAEIWYNEILQDSSEWPKKAKKVPWWTRIKPISGSLLTRYYTPFEHEHQLLEEMIKIEL